MGYWVLGERGQNSQVEAGLPVRHSPGSFDVISAAFLSPIQAERAGEIDSISQQGDKAQEEHVGLEIC
jgi:hypothetical protein